MNQIEKDLDLEALGYEAAQNIDWAHECEVVEKRLRLMTEAVGLATTIKGDMLIDVDDPVGMMQEVCRYVKTLTGNLVTVAEAGEMLWTVVANANWDAQSDEWHAAAERWRDNYFNAICACPELYREESTAVVAVGEEQ